MSLTRLQLLKSTTTLPWTKDFRHLKPVPKYWQERHSFFDPRLKVVPVKDRIKYWNVVPGDQIRIRGDPRETLHEVLSINRFSNRVYLKGSVIDGNQRKMAVNKSVHYSRCQLYIGNFEFPSKKDPNGPTLLLPVFARRVGVRKPHWQPTGHRYEWNRIAVATEPRVKVDDEDMVIPWPVPEPRKLPDANPTYDTSLAAVEEITYQPPKLPSKPGQFTPKPASEDEYIKTLFHPRPMHFDESNPMEVHLAKELSNPHGRAKKQKRWQAAQASKVELLKRFIAKEIGDLRGRSVREAKAEAAWKYRQKLEDDRKAEKKRRWLTKERLASMERKRKRKDKKEARHNEKLNQLVLREEPNQIIPGRSKER
ncbi:hypothetical protein SERLA73DRAFT_166171 [Serpula lacrymans var. lacrymans S7.3]|uniref:KOW domain-containing protein n=2 Tax=Serpula lacrymans var. lacrymans TaxID=341189 RepID=F8PQR2_SERL3|nr:uncharacterized protein SERLADRAFT_460409 [Serpula lacrymans var. lacrymans S7.9]EGO01622.1 hypothetical protein SERLA73DRAFT_166171 [Serpula lacrymans var. lacrymans S7.3]EGO27277.1 hypothetical protein SERLADRAFT_460409 [Serpula lacrymans var. lacrymans S7.9]